MAIISHAYKAHSHKLCLSQGFPVFSAERTNVAEEQSDCSAAETWGDLQGRDGGNAVTSGGINILENSAQQAVA